MRLLVLALVLALLAGCGEDDEPPARPAALAELTVAVDPDGADVQPAKTATVSCDAGDESELCRAVDALDPKVFEPPPGNLACTQQYGGPETATVTGTLRGEAVDARFSRENGCEISRWEDAAPLLEAAR